MLNIHVYRGSDKDETGRFAVVVPGRLIKGSVPRNRFKRQVFSAIQDATKPFFRAPNGRFVIFPAVNMQSLTRQGITEDVKDFLRTQTAP